jgi:hypothetical protein
MKHIITITVFAVTLTAAALVWASSAANDTKPFALQIDFGTKVGTSTAAGANGPAHAEKLLSEKDTHWTTTGAADVDKGVVGSRGKALEGVTFDMGMGGNDGDHINYNAGWHAAVGPRAGEGVYDGEPARFHVRRNGAFGGLRITGLPAGTYRVFVLRAAGTAALSYETCVGADLRRYSDGRKSSLDATQPDKQWDRGKDYTATDVAIKDGQALCVFIKGLSEDDSEARLAGVQIVRIKQ